MHVCLQKPLPGCVIDTGGFTALVPERPGIRFGCEQALQRAGIGVVQVEHLRQCETGEQHILGQQEEEWSFGFHGRNLTMKISRIYHHGTLS